MLERRVKRVKERFQRGSACWRWFGSVPSMNKKINEKTCEERRKRRKSLKLFQLKDFIFFLFYCGEFGARFCFR
jgi:hypothetical protein